MSIIWIIGAFAFVLTPIVFVHELGHFIAARLSNIRVEEFGLGFPPRAAKLFERNGTIYSLNWIPLGGFVRPAGEDDPTVPDGLAAASKRARFFTLVAGAGANFILAFFVFWIAFMIGPSSIAVEDVAADTPAMEAGLQTGDIFLEVDGIPVESSAMLVQEISARAGEEIELLIERDGREMDVVLVPRLPGEYDPEVQGPIGVGLGYESSRRLARGPLEASAASLSSMWEIIDLTVRAPVMLLRGEITPQQARPVGPVGIGQIAGQTAQYTAATGDWFQLLRITAFISVALGFTNLLPIPALDGGRLLFVLIEAVRGRRIAPEREGMVHVLGMLFLLGLMFLLIVQDIRNPIIP